MFRFSNKPEHWLASKIRFDILLTTVDPLAPIGPLHQTESLYSAAYRFLGFLQTLFPLCTYVLAVYAFRPFHCTLGLPFFVSTAHL